MDNDHITAQTQYLIPNIHRHSTVPTQDVKAEQVARLPIHLLLMERWGTVPSSLLEYIFFVLHNKALLFIVKFPIEKESR